MDTDYNPKRLAQITFVVLILLGGLMVLLPFFATILVATVVCITTWPAYTYLLRAVGDRDFIAASLMTILLITIIVVPMVFFAENITHGINMLTENLKNLRQEGVAEHPPLRRSVRLTRAAQ